MSRPEPPAPAVVAVDGLLGRIGGGDGPAGIGVAEVALEDGAVVTVVGDLGELPVGTPLWIVGTWADEDGRGRRLRVADFELRNPDTLAGIERFLASGFIPGIGRELARRLVAHFGADTLRVVETRPSSLLEVAGIGAARASRLAAVYAEHRHVQDVTRFLRGHGVSAAFISRMIRRHGGDVIWVPTPPALIEAMLDLAGVTPADHVIDLGSGDGALVLAAARRGARALGVESNPELVEAARRNAVQAGLAERAVFTEGDLFAIDLTPATVITMFLLPGVNLALRPRLLALRPGTRIVSNTWGMGDWAPDATAIIDDDTPGAWRTALLWIVPARRDDEDAGGS